MNNRNLFAVACSVLLLVLVAIASCNGGGGGSPPVTGAVAQPVFSLATGTYVQGQTLSITSTTPSASIRYTTDGSVPSEIAGIPYNGPVTLDRTGIVKAVAYRTGWVTNAPVQAMYYIQATSLDVIYRDFTPTHADFEGPCCGVDPGIVGSALASDGTPSYANPGGSTPMTTGLTNFLAWYHDTPGVNIRIERQMDLVTSPSGTVGFSSSAFFPLDGLGFGNYASTGHNYHFTTQIHAGMLAVDGAEITITGDDDIWIFINGQLVVDMGGIHGATTGSFQFDATTMTNLGIAPGSIATVDIFQAERHTTASNFNLTATPLLRL